MVKKVYSEINSKMDLLLKDHNVDFDDSQMDLKSVNTFHRKADALLKAHKTIIPEGNQTVAALQTKLNMLIKAHNQRFDDSELDPDSLETIQQKLDVLLHAHGA